MKNHQRRLTVFLLAYFAVFSEMTGAAPTDVDVSKEELALVQAQNTQEPFEVKTPALPEQAPTAENKSPLPRQSAVLAEPSQNHVTEGRLWNLKDVDIRTLINEVSKITGKDFVIAPEVQAKVTFIAHHELTPDELYQAFQAVLRTNGFLAIPEGKIVKIVPDKSPDRIASPLVTKNDLKKRGSEMVVTALRVNNYPATDLVKVIKSLIPVYSYVEVYRPSNDLIIADHADNIVKIKELLKKVDKPNDEKLAVIHLKNASATDLVTSLSKVYSVGRDVTSPDYVQLSADERTNSIIMSGGSRQTRDDVRAAINKLDGDYHNNRDTLEVFYLRYIPAETVAPILQGVVNNYLANLPEREKPKTGNAGGGAAEVSAPTAPARSTTSQFNLQRPMANYDQSSGSSLGGGGSSSGGASSMVREGMTFTPPKSGVLSQNLQWEESTNAVIVTGPSEMIRKVRQVVKKLDIRRPQVMIEVVVAEVGLSQQRELGVEWRLGGNPKAFTHFPSVLSGTNEASGTGTTATTGSTVTGTGTSGTGNGAGLFNTISTLGTGFTFGYFSGGNLSALVRALQNDTRSNVLATPNLVTLDNQEATIKVGKKVSFIIGTINNNPTGGNPFNSYDREDVGLVLVIKPQITDDGAVKLLIQQELSNVIPNTGGVNTNPDTTERYLSTTVMADDGQTIVLGGLLEKDWATVMTKVPFFGDLPGIGYLFRNTERQQIKTNLMIFMRPIVLTDRCQADRVSNAKYEHVRQEQLMLDHDQSPPIVAPSVPGREYKLPKPFICG